MKLPMHFSCYAYIVILNKWTLSYLVQCRRTPESTKRPSIFLEKNWGEDWRESTLCTCTYIDVSLHWKVPIPLKYMYMELTERSSSTDKIQELTEYPGGGWGHSMKLCACTLHREVLPWGPSQKRYLFPTFFTYLHCDKVKACISFDYCKCTVFVNKSLNQEVFLSF